MGFGSLGRLLGELARLCVGRSDYTLMALVFLLNEWTEMHVFSDTAAYVPITPTPPRTMLPEPIPWRGHGISIRRLAASLEPLRREMEALLAGNRVLLYPIYSSVAVRTSACECVRKAWACQKKADSSDRHVHVFARAWESQPEHGVPILRPNDVGLCAIWNLLHMPSTAIPIGRSGIRGLPVAIQAVAARGNDHLTLAVARELERAFGGAIVPRAVPVLD